MSNTYHLNLPRLEPSQAQKHVTVNEALARLDGLTQLILQSVTVATPPASALDGQCYGVPSGATGLWAGQEDKIAIWANGGWVFATPQTGWQGYIVDETRTARFNAGVWVSGHVTQSTSGAGLEMKTIEFDHVVSAGGDNTLAVPILKYDMVIGVTARVVTALTGTLSDWQLGVGGSLTQFGSGLGLAQGSYCRGMMGTPTTYWSDTSLIMTANGGDFASGTIRVAIHSMTASVPNL
ncbi:MAG: DUF2793 domain-containing protein [Halocynthiibacter sp.]